LSPSDDRPTIVRKVIEISFPSAWPVATIECTGDIVATSKRPKRNPKKNGSALILMMPKQTSSEIWRRVEIREALHDLRAKVLRGKTR